MSLISVLAPSRHADLISPGLLSGLESIPVHNGGPLVRRLMSGAQVHPQAGRHVAAHRIDAARDASRAYCDVHEHTVGELNLVLPDPALGSCPTSCWATSCIASRVRRAFHPRRARHSSNVREGPGSLVAIVLGVQDYARSFARVR